MSNVVHDMFADIAPRYDRANDVLSFGIHRLWRDKALRLAKLRPDATLVDVCTGTGDVAFAAAKRLHRGRVIGIDFVYPMLELAQAKQVNAGGGTTSGAVTIHENASGSRKTTTSENEYGKNTGTIEPPRTVQFVHGDALQLPLPDSIADVTTVSFGIRNVDDPLAGLKEMRRVLKPDGTVVVIEFGQPTVPLFATAYRLYSKHLMPRIGGMLTGNRAAYQYLPETAERFPAGPRFIALMQEAGLREARYHPLLGGLAYIYLAQK